MLILLVEDDLSLASLMLEYLDGAGFDCDHCANGEQAVELIRTNQLSEQRYQCIILDLNIPGKDGLEVCQTIRALGASLPVIMLTARSDLDDKLQGFEVGANDYLVKPVALPELVARIHAKVSPPGSAMLQLADLTINLKTKTAKRNQRNLKLSAEEWKLLVYLVQKSPEVVSRIELEELLWPDQTPSKDALKMVLYRLRKQLHQDNEKPLLHTERGKGVVIKEKTD